MSSNAKGDIHITKTYFGCRTKLQTPCRHKSVRSRRCSASCVSAIASNANPAAKSPTPSARTTFTPSLPIGSVAPPIVNGTVNGKEITLNITASGKNTLINPRLQKFRSFLAASYRASSVPRDNDRHAIRAKSLTPQIVTQLSRTLSDHGRASQASLNEILCFKIGCPMAVHQALRTWAEGQSQSLSSTLSVTSAARYVASERL